MNPRRSNRTLKNLVIICVVISCLVLSNILYTMLTQVHFRSGISVEPYGRNTEKSKTLSASRGMIYDRNKEIIAQDTDTYTVYAVLDTSRTGIGGVPAYVVDIKDTAEKLAPKLGMSVEDMMTRFETAQANNSYQTEFGELGKALSTTTKEAIDALELPGIEFTKSSDRYYPQGTFSSQLIGYAQYDETQARIVGKMGLESYLDEELNGTDGEERYRSSASGSILPGTKYVSTKAVDGNDVYLTLDKNVQSILEKSMADTMSAFDAQRAWAVISEVETGRILGYAAYPTFDLNTRDIKDFQNVPSEYLYEPGSVMKGFTYAAAIDSGNYPYDETFRSGSFAVGIDANGNAYRGNTADTSLDIIRDALNKDYGTISFDKGFLLSSNIGICELLTKYLPTSVFEEYLDRFGFFKPVGMEGVNEQAGTKNYTYPIEKLSAGFGQGSSVTALQMVQGYSALFNDGKMMKPFVIDKVVNSYNGDIISQTSPEVVGEPISKETATKMKELMTLVVNDKEGTGYYRFHMDDIEVIGKTGTGEISTDGKYGTSTYVNSFMGAAPADDPKVMMYYVFESGDIKYSNGDFFKSAFRQALIAEGVTGDTPSETESANTSWQEFTMPSLVNHSLDYVNEKTKSMGVNKVVIGDGSSIVKQYPESGDKVISKQNVFLVSDSTSYTMPDMKGWAHKDVQTFAQISGMNITITGNGVVSEQSIKASEKITSETEIKITLK